MGRPGATDSEALMKAGLILVLLGHGILLLGALVHGIVLRQVGLSEQAPAVESTAANIAALLAGLVGTIIGISIIILAKNRDSRTLMWLLLAGSVPGALLAAGSALCLTVTLVKVVVGGRRSLLLQCQLPDMANYSDVHNDYPFSSNHIYGTTLALWVPLLVLCVVESVYFVRCCLASISLLHLPCPSWVWRRTFIKKQRDYVGSWEPEEKPQKHQERARELTGEPQHHWAGPRELEEGPEGNWVEPASEELPEPHIPFSRRAHLNRSSLWI
ncbi:transmembrane protein 54-like isoform X1 [Arapaima gigas]